MSLTRPRVVTVGLDCQHSTLGDRCWWVVLEGPAVPRRRLRQDRAARSPLQSHFRVPSRRPRSASVTPRAPALLLPNMRSLRPRPVDRNRGQRAAPAVLLVVGQLRAGAAAPATTGAHGLSARAASRRQVLHRDANNDGRFQRARDRPERRRDVGCMLRHPGHRTGTSMRWLATHYAGRNRRRARGAQQGQLLPAGQSADRGPAGRGPARALRPVLPHQPARDLARWVDIYTADLDGQWLRLPSGADGEVLCLDLEADPRGRLAEPTRPTTRDRYRVRRVALTCADGTSDGPSSLPVVTPIAQLSFRAQYSPPGPDSLRFLGVLGAVEG